MQVAWDFSSGGPVTVACMAMAPVAYSLSCVRALGRTRDAAVLFHPLTSSIIVHHVPRRDLQACDELGQFLDYCTYGHMIDNVVLIVTGTLHERDVQVRRVARRARQGCLEALVSSLQQLCMHLEVVHWVKHAVRSTL